MYAEYNSYKGHIIKISTLVVMEKEITFVSPPLSFL
jgi:hypothetical protein